MSLTTRTLALGLAGITTAGVVAVVLPGLASAAGAPYTGTPIGTLDVRPASGSDLTAIDYTTSAPCPAGTHFVTRLFGAGMPDAGEVVTSKTTAGFSTSSPISGSLSNTPKFFAEKNTATLAGRYDLVLRCSEQLGDRDLGEFRAVITFSSPTAYTVGAAATPAPSASATPTPTGTAAPTSQPTPSAPARSALTVTGLSPSTVTPGISARITVTGTPNQRVELMAYSQPSTTFAVARRAILDAASGTTEFVIAPGANTRFYVRYEGTDALASAQRVLFVKTAISLSVRRLAPRDYVFEGRLLPRRSGQLITLYRVAGGRQTLTAQVRSDSTGTWRIPRKFTGNGTFDFRVVTGRSLTNESGESNVRRVVVS